MPREWARKGKKKKKNPKNPSKNKVANFWGKMSDPFIYILYLLDVQCDLFSEVSGYMGVDTVNQKSCRRLKE